MNRTLKTILKKEMLLQFKLEDILRIPPESTTTTSTSTTTTSTTTTTLPTTTETTTTMTTTMSTSSATTQPLTFLFGNVASAVGEYANGTLVAEDIAFYHASSNPVIVGYTLTQSPIIGVPVLPQPSLIVVKQVSVDGGTSWDDANTPNGPELPTGSKPWFRIAVSNNGNVPLSNVTVTDPSLGLVAVLPALVQGMGVEWLAKPL